MNIAPLQNLGLSKKAAEIYLATLSLGSASVMQIAKAVNMKRPTAYFHINNLLQEGLLETLVVGKKTYYRAADLEMLQKRAQENMQLIQDALPEFEALRNATAGKPRLRMLEGDKGLQAVYDEITKANAIRFWADLAAFEKKFASSFHAISSAIAENHIRTREIIPDTLEARQSSKRYASVAGKYYASRIATKGAIYNDSAIYGNTIAFFRIQDIQLYVILIEEPTIAATMSALFDMAWESAEPFIPKRS